MSTAYKIKKKEHIKLEMAVTNCILLFTPPTNDKNAVVIEEIRKANIKAIKRGLRDIAASGCIRLDLSEA